MNNPYDIIIIGAGPAGLSAAIYAIRAKLKTLILEDPSVSSQAGYAALVENFPGFPDGITGVKLLDLFKNQVEALGGSIVSGKTQLVKQSDESSKGYWQLLSDKGEYKTLSIIAASGATAKKLQVKGEQEFFGKGVSYCAVCDGVFFKDKHIAVVGGGDSAIEEALFLSRFAASITIIHRRNKLRAAKSLQDRVFSNNKIKIAWNSVIDEISGKVKLERIRLKDTISSSFTDMQCDGVFVAIGKNPNTHFLKDLLDMDENGYIITGAGLKTSQEGVFACGDCRDTLFRQIVTACGDGALAAESCIKYIDCIKGDLYT